MGMDLAVIERRIDGDLMSKVGSMLEATPAITPNALKAAFLETLYANEKSLSNVDQTSLFACLTTFGCLGLMPGSALGNAYILPFKGKATPVIGYKGYVTLAARGGRSIESGVIRAHDRYEYRQGSTPQLDIYPNLEHSDAAVIAGWSQQVVEGLRVQQVVLGIKELLAVKAKSPGSSRGESPWSDPQIGFPAMCQKTAIRRQARALPVNVFQLANSMEGHTDGGRAAWIVPSERGGPPLIQTEDGAQHEATIPPPEPGDPIPRELEKVDLSIVVAIRNGVPVTKECNSIEVWRTEFLKMIARTEPRFIPQVRQANGAKIYALADAGFKDETTEVSLALTKREQE